MKNNKLLILGVFICVVVAGPFSAHAQEGVEKIDVDTNAYELPPQQGTFIPCELCVVLYPERYEKEPQTCPVCHGAKEHFQAAQMMTREMAQMRLDEMDVEIQEFLHEMAADPLDNSVDVEHLKKLRKLYKSKLIHLLVHNFIEVEPVKENIRRLDEQIGE